MKRLSRSWVFWVFVAPPVLGALAFGALRQTGFLSCACGSVRESVVWRLGLPDGPSLPLFPDRAHETPSPIYADILGSAHAHAWRHWYSNGRSLKGPYGLACVLRIPQRSVAQIYDQTPPFKAWLKSKVERGEITPAAVEADLAETPHHPPGRFPFGWTPP